MKTSNTANRLQQIMATRNLKQSHILDKAKPFCKKHNIKLGKSHLSQYVNGKAEPSQDKLFILGLTLNVSEAWLMGYNVPMERDFHEKASNLQHLPSNLHPIQLRRFPMLGRIACGKPIFADEDHESYVDAAADINADFCLTAQGDSMIGARIRDGDVVFIKSQPTVDNGQIAAVIINEEATLKRWYYYPEKEKLILSPENSAYEPLVYVGAELEAVTCLGRAVCFMSNV